MDSLKLQERTAKVERMLEWAQSQGAIWEKIKFSVTFASGYSGVQATSPLSPSETILRIPHSLLLSSHHPALEPLHPLFSAYPALFAQHQHSWWEDFRLALFLIQQHYLGLQSPYEPYISALPARIDSTVAWSQADLDQLQDPSFVQESNSRLSQLIVYWSQLKQALDQFPALIPPDYFSLGRFLWAQFIVSSRTFGRNVPYTTLCPVAELMNHAFCRTYYIYGPKDTVKPSNIEPHDQDDWPEDLYSPSFSQLGVIMKTHKGPIRKEQAAYLTNSAWEMDMQKQQRDSQLHKARSPALQPCEDHYLRLVCGPNESYNAGDEVCLNYGNRSNRAWLMYYGFALASDPYKYELIQLDIKDFLPAEVVKTALECGGKEQWTYKIKGSEICEELITTFRAFNWSSDKPLSSAFYPTDPALEAAARAAAAALLTGQLGSFATSIEEDEALLSTDISLRTRFAVLYRLQRKQVLAQQIALLKAGKST
jgi:hypothetical protein